MAVAELDRTADVIEFSKEDTSNLLKTAKTSLGSKMYASTCIPLDVSLTDQLETYSVSIAHTKFAQIAVDAVMSVADLERKDVDLSLIHI